MNSVEMINKLQCKGYSLRQIAEHTGIGYNRLHHMKYNRAGKLTYSELEAFREYYEKALGLFTVFSEAHERHLANATLQGNNKNA